MAFCAGAVNLALLVLTEAALRVAMVLVLPLRSAARAVAARARLARAEAPRAEAPRAGAEAPRVSQ